ncbi:MAG TPA: PIG-L family deacetylase [Ktedonobacterales bacterium]|nr:PIG-L family deacetylase [Ktedonobacterales bacterium]
MNILMYIALIVGVVLLASALIWLAGFLLVVDFAIPFAEVSAFQRILVIFPHADDEAISCGGALHRFARQGKAVTLIILTKGERGTPDARPDAQLGLARTREAAAAAKTLGIARLIQEDFGDGALSAKRQELATYIADAIQSEQPDLLITYDRAGFYGHPDHIVCSQVVTDVRTSAFPQVALWYVTFPARVRAGVRMPESLAAEAGAKAGAKADQARPTLKVFIGASVFPKIAAWYTYQSQRASLTKGVLRLAPIWFFLSMMLFEYFAEVK